MQAATQTLRLVRGELVLGAPLVARLPIARAARERLRAILAAFARLGPGSFLVPRLAREAEADCELEYPAERPGSVPGAEGLAGLRQHLRAHVPLVLNLARFLAGAAHELADAGFSGGFFSPAQLRFTPGQPDPWRVVLVPILEVELADWPGADPGCWQWAAPEVLLGQVNAGVAYSVGAALHEGLAGELFPAALPAHERFRRVLGGRVGQPRKLADAIEGALPASFQEEGAALAVFVRSLLEPDPEKRPRRAQLDEQLAALWGRLGVNRLALRWSFEGNARVAHDMVEAYVHGGPEAEVPWGLAARLAEAAGDPKGALAAAARALIDDPGRDAQRDYVSLVGRLAGQAPDALVLPAIAALDALLVDDVTRVFLAHLEGRWLHAPDAALRRVKSGLTTAWGECLAAALTARLLCERDDWVAVSRLCKQVRGHVDTMEGQGGREGRYLAAYAACLDGIANFGGVALLRDPSYLMDAYQAFALALSGALETGAEALVDQTLHWLSWIVRSAEGFQAPNLGALRLGVDAYVQARGLGERMRSADHSRAPALPWYDELRLFPRAEPRGGGR